MGWIELRAADGHKLQAWQAQPAGTPRGAVVVLQEIFGVNAHIRNVCDRLAEQGWHAVAPALFDRVQRGQEMGYGPDGAAAGRALREQVEQPAALMDVQAAIDHAHKAGRVAVMGFCWGGTLAWLAAAKLHNLACAVAYYGTSIHANVDERPHVPVLLHFGSQDTLIPPDHVDRIAQVWPDIPLYRYDAGHGFNCDDRPAYHPPSAQAAEHRTQDFLSRHLG